MNILVTGGAGFIGSHTADALAKQGHKITILDNLEPPVHDGRWPSYVSKKYHLVRGSVTKREDWLKALKGVDVVYALAAYQDQLPNFSKFFNTNTSGLALLFELIVTKKLPIKKIIFASTQFVYGDGRYSCGHGAHETFYPEFRSLAQLEKGEWEIACAHGRPATFISFTEDQVVTPPNAYALSKVAKENLALAFGKRYRIPVVGLRYSIVQGPRQSPRNAYSGSLRIFATQALAGRPITVYEDGLQRRDFSNVRDVVAVNLMVLKNKKADYEVFNVGGDKGYTVLEFAKLVKKITGSKSRIAVDGQFRWGDTRHAVSSIDKIQKLGWRPRHTPADAIKEYVYWLTTEWRGKWDYSGEAMKRMKKLAVLKNIRT